MEKQKKSYGKTALIILLLIVTIASLVLATYAWAKYTSTTDGTATAQVAKWNVGVEFTANQFEERYEHVVDNRLAPGMAGSFEIKVDPKDTEVDFDYEIILDKVEATNVDDSQPGKVPAHLHFYTADTTQSGNKSQSQRDSCEIDIGEECESQPSAVQSYLKGSFEEGNTTPVTKIIYWEWPYEMPEGYKGEDKDTYDQVDTTDGQKPVKVKVTFRVIATQKNPGEKTAPVSH